MKVINFDPATSPTVILALSDLSFAALKLLKQKLGDGPWIEQTRQTMITAVKNYAFEGCAMDQEAQQVNAAIEAVNLIYERLKME